jgi:hypothetical protein
LLKGVSFALEPAEFGSAGSVPAHKESSRPEHDDGDAGDDGVFRCLTVLRRLEGNMRAAIYLRVSTDGQTTDNQERELRATAERAGHEVVAVYRDAGISGAKGRDKRPGFDAMHKDAARRRFDIVMAWSVDRLGRSLQDLIAFMQELRSLKIELFLHQQGLSGLSLVTRWAPLLLRRPAVPRCLPLWSWCLARGRAIQRHRRPFVATRLPL